MRMKTRKQEKNKRPLVFIVLEKPKRNFLTPHHELWPRRLQTIMRDADIKTTWETKYHHRSLTLPPFEVLWPDTKRHHAKRLDYPSLQMTCYCKRLLKILCLKTKSRISPCSKNSRHDQTQTSFSWLKSEPSGPTPHIGLLRPWPVSLTLREICPRRSIPWRFIRF